MILRAKTKNEFNPLLQLGMAAQSTLAIGNRVIIVGKGVYPPFSKIPPFLEIQDVPTFHRPIRKTKVLKDSFN